MGVRESTGCFNVCGYNNLFITCPSNGNQDRGVNYHDCGTATGAQNTVY